MPSSAVRTFSDPDDYQAAIRAAIPELTVSARGKFDAQHTRIDLHHVWMQRFSEILPRIIHADHMAGRAIVTLATEPGPSLLAGGKELRPSTIMRHPEAHSFHQRSSGPVSFGTMSLPTQELMSIGAAMGGIDLTPPRDLLVVTPPPAAMARFQRLHAAAGHLANNSPEIIANPDAARGLEQELVEALVGCLGAGEANEDSVAQRQHELIMRRFRRVLEENHDQSLYLPEICTIIGVSDRTLRLCCQEHLGMGPKHYLMLRRLHMARRALREPGPSGATVTEIATRYGFWHFGRFAAAYKSAFGEMPSNSLRRPPA